MLLAQASSAGSVLERDENSWMKQANNNEVDLLLRSLAKRSESTLQGGSAPEGASDSFSAHLDADELNSYAEGLIPAPARTRYTEHLADCSECRRLVIGLTQASGRATRYETPDQERGVGFWQRLAAVFSPSVLRYAVPALVLAGVIGIGVLALRQPRQSDFIAENRSAESSPASVEPDQTPAAGETSSAIKKGAGPQASPGINKEKNDAEDKKSLVAQAPVAESDPNATIAPLDKDAAKAGRVTGGVAELRPSYAPEPKPAAPASPSVVLSEVDRTAGAQAQSAKREGQERANDEYRNQPSDEHGPNRGAAPRSSSTNVAGRRDDGLMRARGPSGQDKNNKAAEAESLTTVAGRRFTREGNTWVDTAYEAPRATINVRRGSEQFRALVADEPGLRTIADQLSGVVIVVWKNRAYRIQ